MRIINTVLYFDHLTFNWCQQRRRKLLVTVSRQISRTADGHLYVLFGLVATSKGDHHLVQLGLSAFVLERVIYFFLKRHVRRNRPPEAVPGFTSIIQASDRFSFPSGHTSAAFLMTALLVCHFPEIGWLFYPWACSVGWSRIMLGVHFPSDTLAGALLGSTIAFGLNALDLPLLQFYSAL